MFTFRIVQQMHLPKMKNFDYLIAFAAYFGIAVFILSGILFLPGTIGWFHDWVIGPYHEMTRMFADQGLFSWNSKYGNEVYHVDEIFRISLLPLSFLNGEMFSKGVLIIAVTLSGFSSFCLGKKLKLSFLSSFSAGLIYIFSPIIFTRIIAGHFFWLIAYSLSPFIVASFLKGKEENRNKYFIISGLLLCIAIVQLQFIVMILIILAVFCLVDFRHIKRGLLGMSIIFLIVFLVNVSPVILSQFYMVPDLPFNPTQLSTVISQTNLLPGFRLLGWDNPGIGYSYSNLGTPADIFSKTNAGMIPSWIFILDFLLPIIAFSALLVRRDKYTISFGIISLIGLFLLKGFYPPLTQVSKFLFLTVLFVFRDTWTTSFVYAFASAILAAIFIEKIKSFDHSNILFKAIIPIILVSLLVISGGYPLLMRNFGGYVQTYNFPEEYNTIYKKYALNSSYNILLLPALEPMSYDGLKLGGLDPLIEYSPNHIFTEGVGAGYQEYPSTGLSSWLISVIRENKTDHFGGLMSGFGINEIILRKDFVSNFINFTYQGQYPEILRKWGGVSFKNTSFEPFLDSQKDLIVVSDTPKYKIYENTNNAKKIFAPVDFAGRLSDFNDLLWISNVTSLSNLAAYPSVYDREPLILLDSAQEKRFPTGDFVDIGKYTDSVDANHGWTENRYWFAYDYLLSSRIHEGAFTSMNDARFSFELPSSKFENKPVEIWAKALKWNKGGKVNFNINGEETSHTLYSLDQKFDVFKIFAGNSSSPFRISINNINGGNYIEGLYIQPIEKEVTSAQNYKNETLLVGIENRKATIDISKQNKSNSTNYVSNSEFVLVNNTSGLPLQWDDTYEQCGDIFSCAVNTTAGWNDNTSLMISTNTSIPKTWSHISGNEINVRPNDQYEVITHMRLNDFATQSHIVIEGFNGTSIKWYQIRHCPTGSNGPLEWHRFGCVVTVPAATSKIRLTLNAGWSSQEGSEATTFFDALYITKPATTNSSNSEFVLVNNITGLPLQWNDNFNLCGVIFSCTVNTATGWNDSTSFMISTNTTIPFTWSHISGKEIGVKPNNRFQIVTHMKLNDFATQSHIAIEGFNETSRRWYQITHCPTGFNGPLEWHMFSCEVTVPAATSKIRPTLNSGWSSQEGSEAASFFDAIYITKTAPYDYLQNAPGQNRNQIKQIILHDLTHNELSSSIAEKRYEKINPTLWKIHDIKATKPFILAFAEPYDPAWEARIYSDGKKVDAVKSVPLYGAINSFHVNQTGELDIAIRYVRQDWFEIGLLISGITIAFCIFYLFYDWPRLGLSKKIRWKTKGKNHKKVER